MDSKQGVCLFFQRTGTCKLGDKCPLSHVTEERGITTKYDDRIWQHSQVVRPDARLPRSVSIAVLKPGSAYCLAITSVYSRQLQTDRRVPRSSA